MPLKTVICFGDSLVFGHGVDRRVRWQTLADQESRVSGGLHYVNCGTSHESTDKMLRRFDAQVLAKKPYGLILMGGSNDLFEGYTPAHALRNLKDMCRRAGQAGIRVWLSTVTPYIYPFDPPYWDREVDFHDVLPKREELNRMIRHFATDPASSAPGDLSRPLLLDAASPLEALPADLLKACYIDELHQSPRGHRILADYIRQQIF